MKLIKDFSPKIKELVENFEIKAYTSSNFKECMECLYSIKTNNKGLLALDTETTSLTFWKDENYILGYSLSIDDKEGYYFNSRCWSEEQNVIFIEGLNSINNDKTFWNWYFDYGYSKAHYNVGLEATHDGMLWFHTLFTNRSLEKLPFKEQKKGFSLKELSAEYTDYGDYESDLKDIKKIILSKLNKLIANKSIINYDKFTEIFINELGLNYKSKEEIENVVSLMNKYIGREVTLKEKQFCYGFFPDSVLDIYAVFDVLCTWNLTNRCIDYAKRMYDNGWDKVYEIIDIKHNVSKLYADASIRGFMVDRDYVKELSDTWKPLREMAYYDIQQLPEIKKAESLIFRDKLTKEHSKKKPYINGDYTYTKFREYFRKELTNMQSKRKSIAPLSRCRKVYKQCKLKFNNKKLRALRSSKVNLTKCRNIYNSNIFNLNSSQHKKVLFIDLMGLEPLEFNKPNNNGEKSAKLNGDFIEHYSRLGYDFMEKINVYMLYQKGISSFLGTDEKSEKGLWNMTSDAHPYNHSNFNLTGTLSSRLATSNLNLSQFPSRGVLHKCKDCFIVEEGYKLFTFDYATSELRILGALAKEENFLSAFNSGVDLHSKTAYSIWKDKMNVDTSLDEKNMLQEVKDKYGDTYRYFAKSIN